MLLDKLEYIIAVAEEQSLTRAAERLYVSQSTLTHYINRLESDLGVKLFDRTKTPVLMTDAGQFYLEQMKKVRAKTQSLRQDLQVIATPSKTLRIGIGQVRGNHWLPIVLPVFCERYPQVNIHVMQGTESQMVELLQTDKMDLAFGALPPSVSYLEIVDLLRRPEPLLLIAHKKYGLIPQDERGRYDISHPYTIQPEQLYDLPFIAPEISNGLYDAYASILDSHNIRPSHVITTTNMITGMNLAIQGLGVQLIYAVAPNFVSVSDMDQLDFCVLEQMPSNRPCVAAYRASNIKTQMIQDFIEIVQQEVVPLVEQKHDK